MGRTETIWASALVNCLEIGLALACALPSLLGILVAADRAATRNGVPGITCDKRCSRQLWFGATTLSFRQTIKKPLQFFQCPHLRRTKSGILRETQYCRVSLLSVRSVALPFSGIRCEQGNPAEQQSRFRLSIQERASRPVKFGHGIHLTKPKQPPTVSASRTAMYLLRLGLSRMPDQPPKVAELRAMEHQKRAALCRQAIARSQRLIAGSTELVQLSKEAKERSREIRQAIDEREPAQGRPVE